MLSISHSSNHGAKINNKKNNKSLYLKVTKIRDGEAKILVKGFNNNITSFPMNLQGTKSLEGMDIYISKIIPPGGFPPPPKVTIAYDLPPWYELERGKFEGIGGLENTFIKTYKKGKKD